MANIVNLDNAKRINWYYGGNAGRKICIEYDGARWMVKFPEPTAGMRGRVASYTTSPVSEWLGSHIYESLGIDVHETMLGYREGKLVCACRDFTWPDKRLVDFHDMKNSLSDDLPSAFENRPSDGRSLYLSDVLAAIDELAEGEESKKIRARFWDMFVVDAFIGNADRNNENWGFLIESNGSMSLAPVFDNGNAFFNKRRDSAIAERVDDSNALKQDAVGGVRSCYLKDDGHAISPMKFIGSAESPECNSALRRFMERIDLDAIDSLIDEIPEEYLNVTPMTRETKEFHKEVLRLRIQECFAPALEKAIRASRRPEEIPPDELHRQAIKCANETSTKTDALIMARRKHKTD